MPRPRADGTIGYTVQIQRKRSGEVVLNFAQTFDRLAAAEAWERPSGVVVGGGAKGKGW